jgi:hypothetical protein
MKSYSKICWVFAVLLILGVASLGEAAVYYYTTTEQPLVASEVVKSAAEFNVMPIDFGAIVPADLGYSNIEEWKTDMEPVPKAFADAFPILLKEANVGNKKVVFIKRDEKVNKGIIVDVAVTKIILNWSFIRPNPDEFICKITFTNAADGQKIYSGVVNVNSRSGNPYAQVFGGGFSSRLQSAAYNIAWVLSKIMINGKVEPADY